MSHCCCYCWQRACPGKLLARFWTMVEMWCSLMMTVRMRGQTFGALLNNGWNVLMTHCGDGVCRLLQKVPKRLRMLLQTFTIVIVNKMCYDKRFLQKVPIVDEHAVLMTHCCCKQNVLWQKVHIVGDGVCANVYDCYCKQNVLWQKVPPKGSHCRRACCADDSLLL